MSKIDTLEFIKKNQSSKSEVPPELRKIFIEVSNEADAKYNNHDFAGAAELYCRLFLLYPAEKTYMYNTACSWALANNKQKAFQAIDIWISNINNGLTWDNYNALISDVDFTNLHEDLKWKNLLFELNKTLIEKDNSFLWGIYFGILFILFFYILFTYISIKDPTFLYYAILILLIFHFQTVRGGHFGGFVTKHFWGFKHVLILKSPFQFFISTMALFYILFVKSFLKLKVQMPKVNKWLNGLIILFSCTAFLFIFYSNRQIEKANENLLFLTYIFLFVIGIVSWKKGNKHARFFVLASFAITFSVVILLLDSIGFNFHFRIGVFNLDNIGMICFFALLSFALGDRINILTKEKAEAQQKAMEKLEELVEERTKEVVEKSKLIEEKNNDIMASIHYAKRIQSALITSQKYIEKNLNRLMGTK